MTKLRTLIFFIFYFSFTSILIFAIPIFCLFTRNGFRMFHQFWARANYKAFLKIMNVKLTVKGLEHIENEPVVFVSKHQSAWDGFFHLALLKDPVFILKWEIHFIPFFNFGIWKTKTIAVKRGKKGQAIQSMISQALDRLKEGRSVIIYPEGTRRAPLAEPMLKRGVFALYQAVQEAGLDIKFVPAALNSGVFWPRRSFDLKSGELIVEMMPPIPDGLDEEACRAYLEDTLIKKSDESCKEAMNDHA